MNLSLQNFWYTIRNMEPEVFEQHWHLMALEKAHREIIKDTNDFPAGMAPANDSSSIKSDS